MTINIATLPFQATTDPNQWIAPYNCVTAQDNTWVFSLQNTYSNGSEQLVPNYVMVDNIQNNGLVDVGLGAYAIQVPQYTRKTIQIPAGSLQCAINATVGTVPVYFTTTSPGVPDDTNQYQINAALAPKAVWTPKIVTANAAQTANDLNAYIEFSSANPITYSLAALPGGTIVPGYYNPKLVNTSTGAVTILPANADEINGVYTNAKPLVLNQGDAVDLFFDGQQWQAHGELQFTSAPIAIAASVGGTVAHTFNGQPDFIWGELVNITGEFGYAAGNIVPFERNVSSANSDGVQFRDIDQLANIGYMFGSNPGGIIRITGTPGTSVAITNANWQLLIRARKRI